ncbi:MAG: CBS domain-containing protein [Bacteroidota bacterium]
MLAKELITVNVPVLRPEDKGAAALGWMELFRISHLPVVKEDEYLGLISDKIIEDLNLSEETIDRQLLQLHTPHIHEKQHLFEVAAVMYKLDLPILPVVDDQHTYKGAILLPAVARAFGRLLSLDEPGGLVILSVPEHSFSVSQIGQIVESNDVRILSFYAAKPTGSERLEVLLKLNKVDISGVIQTFERYDYRITSVLMDDSMLSDLYEDRLEQFLKFMNI